MHQARADTARRLGQPAWAFGIAAKRRVGLGFGAVDLGVGRRIEDPGRPQCLQHTQRCPLLGHIEVGTRQCRKRHARRHASREFDAQLSARPYDRDLQAKASALFSERPVMSLGDSTGT